MYYLVVVGAVVWVAIFVLARNVPNLPKDEPKWKKGLGLVRTKQMKECRPHPLERKFFVEEQEKVAPVFGQLVNHLDNVPWYTRVLLLFVRERVTEDPVSNYPTRHRLIFKTLFGKLYVLREEFKHQRK